MKTIISILLATASLARAVVFTGHTSLASPYAAQEAVVAIGAITLQATAGEATFSAMSWVVGGRLVLASPGNYVVTATAGGIVVAGGIGGPASGTATLRLVAVGGAVVQSGQVAGNVTILQGPSPGPVVPPSTTVGPTLSPPLSNLSVRVMLAAGQPAIAGLVVGGVESRRVLVRAVGPSLDWVPGVQPMSDPILTVFSGAITVATNDDWGGAANLEQAFARVGAFPLPPASKDAALVLTLSPGPHTVEVRGTPAGTAGEVLIEIYLLE
jgi:hypothetical protein